MLAPQDRSRLHPQDSSGLQDSSRGQAFRRLAAAGGFACGWLAGWLPGMAGTGAVLGDDARLAAPTAEQVAFFEARIRPVLVEHCYRCHSAESTAVKGGLRLDHAGGWRVGGDSGPAILPGKPDESLLIQALRYERDEMPPDGQLPPAVVADFERWVRLGAPDPRTEAPAAGLAARPVDLEAGRRFWSFRPLADVSLPTTVDADWPRTPIDRFLLARLEADGQSPSPDAPADLLLRRITFDLTGLPPTVAELQAFRQAAATDLDGALAEAVDRLLASPGYGEHWGRHWLDIARYADSNGGDFNATFHDAWRYRDYVIRAFQHDRPFDQFLREQIAGDLLPYDSDAQREEQLVATGFLALGPKMLSERDKPKLQMDVVDEQITSVGQAFLGMTLGCARCHDHKFDPIPTTDYYALAGIFRSTRSLDGEIQKYVSDYTRQRLPIAPEHAAALARHVDEVKAAEQALAAAKQAADAAKKQAESARDGSIVVDDAAARIAGAWKQSTHVKRFVGVGYIHDDKQGKGEWSVAFTPTLPQAGEYEVRFAFPASGGRDRQVPVRIRHADGETLVQVDQTREPPIDKLWLPLGTFRFEAGESGSVTISSEGTTEYVVVDAVAFVPVKSSDAASLSNAATDPAAEAREAEVKRLTAEVARLEQELKELKQQAPPPAPLALAVLESPEIGDCAVCIRGEHNRAGPVVPRGFLQVAMYGDLPEFPSTESGRRQLADWIADPRHPLTARVFVNRVWSHLFGAGIVRSVDNFGLLGDSPSHPELLDWLAGDFIAHGWSVRHVVRQIVLSRAYRQQALHREDGFAADPENRLLWRAHRRRLPAEGIRDALLLLSGGLDRTAGGSPVAGLGTLVSDNSAAATKFESQETGRRSVYLPIIRNELPTMLSAFDFADPDFVTGQRAETNVPAQALLLLNSPFVRSVAEQMARRLVAEASGDPAGRVVWAYETILSRTPTGPEIDRGVRFVETFAAAAPPPASTQPVSTQSASAQPDSTSPVPVDPAAITPWARLAQALFASTEFRLLE